LQVQKVSELHDQIIERAVEKPVPRRLTGSGSSTEEVPACDPGIVKSKNVPDDQCKFSTSDRRTKGLLELGSSVEEVN
jgi:hypothetical protein